MKNNKLILILLLTLVLMSSMLVACNNNSDYTITLNTSGGSEDGTIAILNKDNKELPNPNKDGYNFTGWFSDDALSNPFSSQDFLENSSRLNFGDNGKKAIFASWEAISFDIIYFTNGGINNIENPDTYTIEDVVTLKNPTRNGYTFDGWYKNGVFSGNATTTINEGTVGIKNYYAKWLPYDITYFLNGGINNSNNVPNYNGDNEITLFPPTKTGYVFEGWYNNSDYTGDVITSIAKGSTRNRDFYAKWNLSYYDINYSLDGGTNNGENPNGYTVKSDITLLSAMRNGYDFDGWYNTFNDTKVTSINVGSSGDLFICAKWTAISYDITYILYNGLNSSENPLSYTIEDRVDFEPATREGYIFENWLDASNKPVLSINVNSTGAKVLYAKWQEAIYSISYALDNGNNSSNNPTTYTIEGTITLQAASKYGHKFMGWFLNQSFEGDVITQIPLPDYIGHVTFYAKFLVQYPITYNLNNGTNNVQNPPNYASEDIVSLLAPSRVGYLFDGWYQHSDFSGEVVTKIEKQETGAKVLYAKWTPIDYTLTYFLNEGQQAVDQILTYTIENAVTLKTPSRFGYTFRGWYYAENYTGNAVANIAEGTTGNRNLYARWQETKYDIIYDLGGGGNHSSNPKVYTINNEIVFERASRPGFVFDGWYSDIEKTQPILGINIGSTGNINIYAKFYQLYNINYTLNGGINNNTNPLNYTIKDAFILKDPAKTGSRFIGWYANSAFAGEKITEVVEGTIGEKSFYAKFLLEYSITYELMEGNNAPENPAKYIKGEEIVFANPTKIGYAFIGWYSDADHTTQVTKIVSGSVGSTTIYAKWEINIYSIDYILNEGENNTSNPSTYTVQNNISLLPANKAGYLFMGWYKNDDFSGNKLTEITPGSTGDIGLYAKFLHIYTVSYELDGGTNSVHNPIIFNTEDNIELLFATKLGYDFGGWLYNGNVVVKVGEIEEDLTLIAQWTMTVYSINYHTDGGTTASPTSYTIADTIDLLQADKIHFSFVDWYTNESFDGDAIELIEEGTTGDIALYAKYTPYGYPINYVLNGGKNHSNNSETYTIFDDIDITPASRNECIFLGWFDNASFIGSPITNIELGSFGDITIYAKWQVKTYSIMYVLNNGTNGAGNPSTYTIDDSFVLSTATKAEYDFGGWYSFDTSSISSSDLLNGNIEPITSLDEGSIGDIILYARWLADEHTISYVLNGGINNNNNLSVYTRDNHIILYSPTREAYTFKGWYDNSSFSGAVITSIPLGTTGNKTFYAKFSLTYTITYILNTGTLDDDKATYTQADNTYVLKDPIRSGFIFSGWFDNAGFNGEQITEIEAGSTGDKVFHAKFLQEFSISYTLYLGTNDESNPQTYTVEDAFILNDATRIGYMFKGWYDNAAFAGDAKTEIIVGESGNINLYAKFLFINELTYILNGGTNNPENPAFFTIEDNIILENPLRNGYTFVGWYNNANFIDEPIVAVGYSSSSLRSLYAKWVIIEYDIVYNVNGGQNDLDNPVKYTVTSPTIMFNPPNRIHYQFLGWYNNAEFTGSVINSIPMGGVGEKEIYAKWSAIDFEISYNLYDGTNVAGNPSTYTVNDSTITLLAPSREGATFLDWYDNSSFSGSSIKTISASSTGARMLYARWQLTNYDITYDLNGGGYPLISENSYNIENIIVFGTAIKAYNTFIGWYENENLSGEKITSTMGKMGDIKIYAKFSTTYSITYMLNDGKNNAGNVPTFTEISPTIALLSPTKSYYNFINWYRQADFSGAPVTEIATGSNANITLYAKWSPIVYDINYYTDGGTNNVLNPTNYNIESSNIYLENPTKIGCEFIGWYDNIELIGNIITAIPIGSKGVKNLYAKWSLNNYDINYHLDGGINADNNPSDYTVESSVIVLVPPNKSYYTFEGWYGNAEFSGNTIDTIASGSIGNVELYAKYSAIIYDIYYHISGGENDINNCSSYSYEDTFVLGQPTKDFYIFKNWYTNEYFTGNPIETITARHGELNLYAKWQAVVYEIVYGLNGGNNNLANPSSYTVQDSISLQMPTKAGYNFLGWFDNTNFDGEAIESIVEGANGNITLFAKFLLSYTINYNLNGGNNDSNNHNSYTIEDNLELFSPTKDNHIFIGWYNNSSFSGDIITELSAGNTGDKVFYACFEYIYTISYVLNGGINNVGNPSYYTEEIDATIFAPERAGYMFLGWYTNVQFSGEPITIVKGEQLRNITLYAWWGEWGYYLYYGEYPQTQETDSATISALDTGIGQGLIEGDSQGYYSYGGERYAKVEQQSSTNGYISGQTYYFLVEPIKWRIMQEDSGEVMLLSEVILDSISYNELYTSIGWEFSSIREWLNNEFFASAFYSNYYHILQTETTTSTNPVHNTSSGTSTMDNFKLFSIENATNENYGFSAQLSVTDENRIAQNTDYARARGAYTDLEGNGMWWLYSSGSNDKYAAFVGSDGKVYTNGDNVTMPYYGVRPTIYITLNKVS